MKLSAYLALSVLTILPANVALADPCINNTDITKMARGTIFKAIAPITVNAGNDLVILEADGVLKKNPTAKYFCGFQLRKDKVDDQNNMIFPVDREFVVTSFEPIATGNDQELGTVTKVMIRLGDPIVRNLNCYVNSRAELLNVLGKFAKLEHEECRQTVTASTDGSGESGLEKPSAAFNGPVAGSKLSRLPAVEQDTRDPHDQPAVTMNETQVLQEKDRNGKSVLD